MMELYKRYRPAKFADLVGQSSAVQVLTDLGRKGSIPHTILLSGPSGVGKTTIARILRRKLHCSDVDFSEVNVADFRGIDMVRDIRSHMSLSPCGGKCRMWLIDECFSSDTLIQSADGPVVISSVKKGQLVHNIQGVTRVQHVFRNRVALNRVVKLRFDDGKILYTTKQHRFLTSVGWVEAQSLQSKLCELGGFYQNKEEKQGRLSSLLQGRYRQSKIEGGDRGRWERTSVEKEYLARCEEDPTSQPVRVESIEVYQQGSNDESFRGVIGDRERDQGFVEFYDLQVEGHPSYFAEGLAVHNCHKLTSDAQDAFLKLLEDTPKHVYFVLCTTEPQKLKKTIKTRATHVVLKQINAKELQTLLLKVIGEEQCDVSEDVVDKIIQFSDGSARKALVLLEQVMGIAEESDQLEAIASSAVEKEAIELARLLINPRTRWPELARVLKALQEQGQDAESLRWMVLGYCKSVMLGGGKLTGRACAVIDEFRDDFYSCKWAGLVAACYEIISD
ncbi:MAG: AAA family ATPase [Candidatus Methanospirareceae archaeon]